MCKMVQCSIEVGAEWWEGINPFENPPPNCGQYPK